MNDGSQPEGTLPEGDNMGEDRSSGPTPVESSDSKIAWCTIIFMLLGVLFIVFCGILLVLCLQKRRRPQEVATTTTAITEAAAMTTTTSKGEDPEARAGSIVDVHLANEDASASNDNFWAFMIMAVSAMAALSLSIVTHTSCEYMDVDNEYDSDFSSIGLWSVALTYDGSTGTGGDDTCYSNVVRNVDGRDEFEDFDVNTALQIARVAGIIATTLGGIFFVSMIMSVIFSSTLAKQLFRPWLSVLLLLVAFCQALTLSLAASQPCDADTCFIDLGAISACTAGLHWLVCAFAVLVVS
mmetsp:Transcript_1046/g.2079  ORF Transcript_1046/g.2079 Transcript_1046/m.2079 type:complete len:297 (-) Transcript_1046:64-954(-)